MLLDFSSVFNRKFNTFCSDKSVSRLCFCQFIFLSNYQLFDCMSFFCGSPFIYGISCFIRYFQVCTWKFFPGCQIGFCQLYCGRFIFKGELISDICDILALIFKGKLLFFLCCYESFRSLQFFHIILTIYWQICKESNSSVFIGCLLFDNFISFQKNITGYGFDIFCCKQSKDCPFQYTVTVFFFLQNLYRYFLAGILPVFIISDYWGILITIAQVYISDLIIQNITMSGCHFFHIILAYWKISQLCNTCIICNNGSHQIICLVIVFTYTICSFDIFCRIYLKSDFCQITGNILKQMLYSTFCVIQKSYFIKKLSLFVDDQKGCRHFIFHFHLLYLCSIFQCKFYVCCFQITVWCNFFSQSVLFTNNQTFDYMWLVFYRSPFIHHITIFIKDFQACTLQLSSCSNIGFCNFYRSRLIFLYLFQFHYCNILSLIESIKSQNFIR